MGFGKIIFKKFFSRSFTENTCMLSREDIFILFYPIVVESLRRMRDAISPPPPAHFFFFFFHLLFPLHLSSRFSFFLLLFPFASST